MLKRGVGSRRIVYFALAALLMAAGLSACGNSSSTDPSASSPASSSNVPASDAASSAATANPSVKTITLSWSPPTKNSDGTTLSSCPAAATSGGCLAGYTLHYGTSSQDYTGEVQITDPTATSYVVSDANFPSGTYYFAISAYNGVQSSSPMSGEVQVTLD